jgi:hypothetical protein
MPHIGTSKTIQQADRVSTFIFLGTRRGDYSSDFVKEKME